MNMTEGMTFDAIPKAIRSRLFLIPGLIIMLEIYPI